MPCGHSVFAGQAIEEDVEFRRGLPVDYLTYMGAAFAPENDPAQGEASQGKGKGKKVRFRPLSTAVVMSILMRCASVVTMQASSASKGQAAKQQQFESKVVSLLHR